MKTEKCFPSHNESAAISIMIFKFCILNGPVYAFFMIESCDFHPCGGGDGVVSVT